jgi:hypothetical protein
LVPSVADWVELTIATTGNGLSKTITGTEIEKTSGEEPTESFLTDVWRELAIREQRYSEQYFIVSDRSIEPNSATNNKPVYLFCLLLSLFGNETEEEVNQVARLFERISSERLFLAHLPLGVVHPRLKFE